MNGIAGTAAMGAMYVRALYDYEADDRTSLSFHEADVIQVITRLESGWWEGVIHGVRGRFPINYCQIITSPDDLPDAVHNGALDDAEDAEIYDHNYDQDDDSEQDGPAGVPREDSFARTPLQRGETMPYERPHQRTESRTAPVRPPLVISQLLSEGEPPAGNLRKGNYSKVKKILGEGPSPQAPVTEDTPEFLLLDYENEVSWDAKTSPPTIRGGSLLALVEQLTRHDKLDSNFNNTFLLTYRSFTSARELFELLVKRYGIQPPEGLTQADYEAWRDRKQKLIQFQVVNILKSWFGNLWMEEDNKESKQLIRDVYTFARDTVKSTETPDSAPLMAILDQRLGGKEAGCRRMIQTADQNMPTLIMPNNMKKLKFLDIDVVEFARQLTIVESRLYGKIKASECLNKTWQKKVAEGEPDLAPNVKALIHHSNQMTNWVAEMILAQMDVKKRVFVIKYFVSVADVSAYLAIQAVLP